MRADSYGQLVYSEKDLCELYHKDPLRQIKYVLVDFVPRFDDVLELENLPEFITYNKPNISIEEFDLAQQLNWYMPENYKSLDIAKYILNLCKTDEEIQRVGHELLLYQERDMFDLLRYLVYLVDVMRQNNIVWGVGRGSSIASFVLFLIGIHKINSLFYDLDIEEFLK